MTEWISVKDRLPEHGEYILLTYTEDHKIHKDMWCEKGKWMYPGEMDFYGETNSKVTHWMPFPETPND